MRSVPLIVTDVENRPEDASFSALLHHSLPRSVDGLILLPSHSPHLPVRRQASKHFSYAVT